MRHDAGASRVSGRMFFNVNGKQMMTSRATTWGKDEVIPAGTEIRVVAESDVDRLAGTAEGRAVRDCAARMRQQGQRPVFGVVGRQVRCFERSDFE